MAKVVVLGHATDNCKSIDSSQYQIQVTRNLSDFSDKSGETYTSKESHLSLSLVTDLNQEKLKPLPDKSLTLVTKVGTSFSDKSENGNTVTKISSDKSERGNVVTKIGTKSSDKLEMLVYGDFSDTVTSVGTKPSDSIKPLPDNNSSYSVTKVTKISSNEILKIGDRVRYVGNNKSLLKQYAGVLVIHELNSLQDEATCLKPTGSLTSWVKFEKIPS